MKTYAIQKTGATTPKPNFQPINGPAVYIPPHTTPKPTNQSTPKPVVQGTNPGMLPTPTTFGNGFGQNFSNQADASASYTKNNPTATTALKSTSLPDGTKYEYHAPETPAVEKTSTNYSSSNPATFPGLINTQANVSSNAANTGAENYNTANIGLINSLDQNKILSQRAQEIANTAGQTISDIGRKGAMGQAGYRTTGTSPVGEGNSAVLGQTTAAQQQAVAQGANMELQGTSQGLTAQGQTQLGFNQAGSMGLQSQGQGITGLGNIAGQISPQLGDIGSKQYYDPLNPGQSGQGGLDIQGTAKDIIEGRMTIDQGNTTLGGNVGLTNMLRDEIKKLNPNFNFAQSSTMAGTQGSIQLAYDYADKALTNLDTIMKSMKGTSNITPLNTARNIASLLTGIGSEKTREYVGAVNALRASYSSLLQSAGKASTPSIADAQAFSEIPDYPTENDLKGIKKNFETLGKAKTDVYGNPGQSGTSGGSTGGSYTSNSGNTYKLPY